MPLPIKHASCPARAGFIYAPMNGFPFHESIGARFLLRYFAPITIGSLL